MILSVNPGIRSRYWPYRFQRLAPTPTSVFRWNRTPDLSYQQHWSTTQPHELEVEQVEGMVKEISGMEELHEAILDNIHCKRFYLAEEAHICSGPLRGAFGYNSVTPTAKAIPEGSYDYPPEFDEATKEILQECALI